MNSLNYPEIGELFCPNTTNQFSYLKAELQHSINHQSQNKLPTMHRVKDCQPGQLCDSVKLVENNLIDICQYSIIPNQIAGLLPLKCSKKLVTNYRSKYYVRSLEFKIFSGPFFAAISVLSAFLILCAFFFTWLSDEGFGNDFMPPDTSDFANYTMMFSGTIFTATIVIQRVYAIANPLVNLKLWKAMVQILSRISNSNEVYKISAKHDTKYCQVFLRVKQKIRNSFLKYSFFFTSMAFDVTVYIIMGSADGIGRAQKDLVTAWYGTDLLFFIVTTSWSWYSLIHWLIFLWLSMPLRLCEGCLNMITLELNGTIIKESMQDNSSEILLNQSKKICFLEVGDIYRPVRCTDHYDEALRCSIKNLYEVQSIVKLYHGTFGRRLVLDVLSSVLITLGCVYMGINSREQGFAYGSVPCFADALASLHAVYDLGSAATDMETACNDLIDALCRYPLHLVSKSVRTQVNEEITFSFSKT